VSEEFEQIFLSFEVVGEIAPCNAGTTRSALLTDGVEYRGLVQLMVSQEVDQLQGLETIEPAVKLGLEALVMSRVLLQARPDLFKTVELEELPQLGGDAGGPAEKLRGAAIESVADLGQPVTEDSVTLRMVDG
jgi:hypothetical protein